MDSAEQPRIERYAEVGSTNAVAMQRARSGEPGPLWILADVQSEGHGRRGRPWQSPPGNLYASYLERRLWPGPLLAMLPLAAAVALREALAGVAGLDGRIRLKWPNDVLIDGRKTAGILLESLSFADGACALVAGFGVNVASTPSISAYPVTCLADCGAAVPTGVLHAALDRAWRGEIRALLAPDGADRLRHTWREHAIGMGDPIEVRFEHSTLRGRFRDLDPACRLLLEADDGTVTAVASGDVFFRGAGAGA